MDYLTTFAVGFVTVFAMGFQSRAVNYGNYRLAAANSFFIGATNAALWTHIVKTPDVVNWLVYGLSGSLAITASMYVHERYVKS